MTGYGLDDRCLIPGKDRVFLFAITFRQALGSTRLLFALSKVTGE
jgi:hypothetical protein